MTASGEISPIQVVAGVIYCGEKLLIARRAPGKHLAGMWEFPGGKIEAGETVEQCLARELVEEFGLEVEVLAYIGARIFDYGDRQVELHACFGETKLSCGPGDSHDEVAWIEVRDLESYEIAPADAFIVDHILSAAGNRTGRS